MEEIELSQESSRIFGYARVSTEDQTTENQVRKFKEIGIQPENIYTDDGVSGTIEARKRKAFKKLYDEIQKGNVDKLYVFELSRLGRNINETLRLFIDIDELHCRIISLSKAEAWTNMDNDGLRMMLSGIFAWVADQERKTLVERTKAGMDRARAEGKQIGRPKKAPNRNDYNKYKAMGLSKAEIGKLMSIPIGTLYRYVDAWEDEERIARNRMI